MPDGTQIMSTLACGVNPTIFVKSKDIGLGKSETDVPLYDPFKIDHLRKQGAEMMELPLTDAVRVACVSPPLNYVASDGQQIKSSEIDIHGYISTPGRIHHAFTGTGALNLSCVS